MRERFTFKRAGVPLAAGQSVAEWTRNAGLDFAVDGAALSYDFKGQSMVFPDRKAIIRRDTGAALGFAGLKYNIVQPSTIMDFFCELADKGDFELEAAGAFRNGAKIWCLARVGPEAKIIGQDTLYPYLLLSTSYDGSLATTGCFTGIRPSCENSLRMAIAGADMKVRVPHNAVFNADNVREELGIALDSWQEFILETRRMAESPLPGFAADQFLVDLLGNARKDPEDVRESTTYRKIMGLFEGGAIGSELTEGRTQWAMLNAVTEFADHHRGNSLDKRLENAWFGAGDVLKNKAFALLADA